MEEKFEVLKPIWYVGKGQYNLYRHHTENVRETGSLVNSRNQALSDAWSQDKVCVIMDDDLEKVYWYDAEEPKKFEMSIERAIETILSHLNTTAFKLAGIPPTDNEYFIHENLSTNLFIIGNLMIVKPCSLFFDINLTLKEDYDYTLQHIARFGGALRCNFILANFKRYTNAGGVVDYRTEQEEQKNITYLKHKWFGAIADNPKRENEILLKPELLTIDQKSLLAFR